jgi:bacteriorhodopsin
MNKINLKTEFICLLMLAIPLVYLAMVWNRIPDIVPVHFNAAGEADRQGSKTVYIWLVSLPGLLFYLLLVFIPLLNKQQFSLPSASDTFNKIRLCVSATNCVIFCAIVHVALTGTMAGSWYIIIAALLFLVASVVVIIVRSGSISRRGQPGESQ